MGTTFYNFHIRTTDSDIVKQALADTKSIAWISTEPENGWISVYPYRAEAKNIAESLKLPVIYLSLYDDDIAQYELYENGELVDEFNSSPDYWVGQPDEHGDDIEPKTPEEREKLSGQPEKLLPYCLSGVGLPDVQAVLGKTNQEVHIAISESTGKIFDVEEFGENLKTHHAAIQEHLAKYSQIYPYSLAFPEGFTPSTPSASELAQGVLNLLDAFSIIEGLANLLGLSERLHYHSGYGNPIFEEAFSLTFIGEQHLTHNDVTSLLDSSIPNCRVFPNLVQQPDNKLESKLKSMRLWLSLGANPNGNGSEFLRTPPLFNAIRGGSVEAVRILLEAGANVNFVISHDIHQQGNVKLTALTMAKDNQEMLQLLREAGARE
jgi:hypothetical protein